MAKALLVLVALFLSLSDHVLGYGSDDQSLVKAPAPAPVGHHHHHHHKAPVPSPSKPPTLPPIHPPTLPPAHPPTHHHHAPSPAPIRPPTKAPIHPPTKAPIHPPTKAPIHPPTKAPIHPPTKAPIHPPTHAPAPAPVHPPTVAPTPSRPFPRSFVAVQGVVYCLSCKYQKSKTLRGASPLIGAKVKMVCKNTKYRPTVVVTKTNKKGYFYLEAPKNVTSYAVHTCKVSVSPVKSCKKPTAFVAGPLRPKKHFISKKLPFVLYSVGPIAFGPTCKHT